MTTTASIYGLSDPETGEIRYVGFSKDPKHRRDCHLAEAKVHPLKKSYKLNWIRSLLKRGLCVQVVILQETTTKPNERERYWIARLKKRGCRLTNLTDGGEGVLNLPISVRKRVTAANKKTWSDPILREKHGRQLRAVWADPKLRKRASKSQRLAWKNPEHRAIFQKAHKAHWADPVIKEVLRTKALARWADPAFKNSTAQKMQDANKRPAVKRNRSHASKALWKDPAYRAKTTEGVRKGITALIESDPDYKKKLAEGARAHWAKPEARKKQSERMKQPSTRKKLKAYWKDPAWKASFSEAVKKAATPERRAAISSRVKGFKHSPEARKKISDAAKAQWANPKSRKRIHDSLQHKKAPVKERQDELPGIVSEAIKRSVA